jgi:hypothetical protein
MINMKGIQLKGKRLTEFDFPFSHHEVGSIGFVVDIGRFIEQGQKLLGVNEALVYGAVNIAKLVERPIELSQIGDEGDERAGFSLATGDSTGDKEGSNKQSDSLNVALEWSLIVTPVTHDDEVLDKIKQVQRY